MRCFRKIVFVLTVIIAILTSCTKHADGAPGTVINIFPAQSELIYQNYFYSKWTRSIDPEGGPIKYRINYARSVDALDDPVFFETEETYFLLPNLEPGVWYWKITAVDSVGNSTESPLWNFTVNGTSLPQPVNIGELPVDPSLLVSGVANTSFTLRWPEYEDVQDPLNEVYYTIYIYESDMTQSWRKIDAVKWYSMLSRAGTSTTVETTDTSYTFRGLNSNTLYDWTIIAQCDASRTSIVGSAQVRTGNRSPTKPQLLLPDDGATDCATDTLFGWMASTDPEGDAFRYYLYLDTIKNTNKMVSPVEGIDETFYIPEGVELGKTYYWYVLAKDLNGAATRTAVRHFMTSSPALSYPSEPTPADGATGVDTTRDVVLMWQHDQGNRQVKFNLYFGKNPRTLALKAEGVSEETYIITEYLDGESIYYWQIEAVDQQSGETARGALWQFETEALIPPQQIEAKTNTEGSQIELAYDKRMANPDGQENQFTVNRVSEGVISSRRLNVRETLDVIDIELKPGEPEKFLLTLDSYIQNGDIISISYERGMVHSVDKAWLESYQDATVTNMVPGQVPVLEVATATANTLMLHFDKAMKEPPSSATENFIVQSDGNKLQIHSVERQTDETVYCITLKDGYRINYGEEVLLSYNKGKVQAQNEACLETFIACEVINTVSPEAPVLTGKETNTKGNQIILTFDREMVIEGDQSGYFGVQVSLSAVARNRLTVIEAEVMSDRTKIELTLNQRVKYAECVKVSYTPGTVKSSEGASLETVVDEAVVNNVPIQPEVERVETDTNGKQLTVVFNKEMKTPESTQSTCFAVQIERVEATTGKRSVATIGVTAITLDTNKEELNLTLESTINNGDDATLSYVRGGIESSDDGWLKGFEKAVVNNVMGKTPQLVAATLTTNGTEITAAFNMKMAEEINGKKEQFAVRVNGLANTIQSIARSVDHRTYIFEVTNTIEYGEQVTLSYTKGSVKAEYGSWLESFMDHAVTNRVAPLPPQIESVYTNDMGDFVYVSLNKVLETPVDQKDHFSLSMITPVSVRNGLTVENATLSNTDEKVIGLALSGYMNYGERYNLSFVPGHIETTEGATLATFTREITNNVSVPLPHFVSATLTAKMNQIEVGFDQNMRQPTRNELTQFSVMVEGNPNQVVDGTLKPGDANVIVLALEKPVGRGNSVSVSYYKGTLDSENGGVLDNFLNQSADISLVTDYLVSNDCLWHHSTIQDAIDDPGISDGAKIIVYPGTYRENIEVYNNRLHITSTEPASPTVVQSTILKVPYDAFNPFELPYVFDVYDTPTIGTIIEGFTIGNYLSFGVFIEESRVTVRNNIFDGMEDYPAIAVLSSASDTISGVMTEISSNTFRNGDFYNGDSMIYVGEGSDAMIYGNVIKNNTGSPGNGVWVDNEYADSEGHTTVYNYDGNPWLEFNCPHATVSFIEHNSDPSFNNIYSNNGTDEGNNILFTKQDDLPEQTAAGTLVISPATETSTGAPFTITATYTFDGFSNGGTLALTMEADINLTTSSKLKIGDAAERNLAASEISGHTVNLSGITGENVQVVFKIVQTDNLVPTFPLDYPFLAEADRDGVDTLYDLSGGAVTGITIFAP